ncbi:Inner membrane protein YbjJ [Emticicia aquatica]|jgi:MFS family permease|uniref:Inner membrane protein YbjJ n=1 Tax=Emticicia aquatica TaxID=1681835 RepID=A0ABM9AR45_9BACT|nr:MFS transporter [Emticicia aquatica]CAH0996378.1 Inner membrane protein YbjJ [Emticicia aquatica]
MLKHLRTFFTHRQSLAIGMVFISVGFLFGNWATLIPYIKQKFDLNDAQLGLLLLSMPFGATAMNPFSTYFINRFGMLNTTILGLILLALTYTIPVSTGFLPLVSFGLILVGVSLSVTNVAMNTCVTSLEHQFEINIMSTCHGMFSAGLMFGSIAASILRGMKIEPSSQMIVIAIIITLLVLILRPIILGIHEEKITETEGGAKFILPKGALLLMILISLCTNVTEGTMADWTAVYMRDIVQTDDYFIGWGLAGYSMFMSLGRFVGDALIPRFGGNAVLRTGGIIAALGIALAVIFPYTITAILGFTMVGAGVSCGAPILYGSAARVPGMAKGAGLATMNTFSMAGFLAGPVFIGFVSKSVSLPFAISLVAILALVWSFLVNRVKLY